MRWVFLILEVADSVKPIKSPVIRDQYRPHIVQDTLAVTPALGTRKVVIIHDTATAAV